MIPVFPKQGSGMFLVKHNPFGFTNYVFTGIDPREDGFHGKFEDGVSLDYNPNVHKWDQGKPRPELTLSRSRINSKEYKVFQYPTSVNLDEFEPLPAGNIYVFHSWEEYTKLKQIPPDPDETKTEEWFDYLDRVDEVSRKRRTRVDTEKEPDGSNRDEVAHWLAKGHMLVDTAIREVLYLPADAESDEIRLIETSDRFPNPNDDRIEPFESRQFVGGKSFRLKIVDVNSEQLTRLIHQPKLLPKGWSFNNKLGWKRGG